MKNKAVLYIALSICFFGLHHVGTKAQDSENRKAGIVLFTDRTLYITGEQILFAAFGRSDQNPEDRVLLVEIITPDGIKITGGKYRYAQGNSKGCITIPRDVITGNYYIRAYTNFLRNHGPSAYGYVPLKLINPSRADVLTANGIPGNREVVSMLTMMRGSESFRFIGARTQYGVREQASLKIQFANGSDMPVEMCITVAAEGATVPYDPDRILIRHGDKPAGGINHAGNIGLSLSGTLFDNSLSRPVQNGVVTLSVMGDKNFSAFETGTDGRFYFTLPDYAGNRDIFLSSKTNAENVSLLIDNDFCTIPVKLPNPAFSLSEAESEMVYKLAVNSLVSAQYLPVQTEHEAENAQHEGRPFYGKAMETLIMDNYVQLPTLQEYFNELPLEVKVRERKEGKYFRFISQDAAMIMYDPLVLVDWVVISDMEKVLSLAPQKVDRIEIVNKPYVKGNLTYSGIISILSEQGDFAGIDLPGSGLFLRYDFFSPECGPNQSLPEEPNFPDTRNTVLWIPDSRPDTSGTCTISFVTPDTPGMYEIWVRGILPDGRIAGQSVRFEVSH